MVYLNSGKDSKDKFVNTKIKWSLVVVGGFEDGWNAYSKSDQ